MSTMPGPLFGDCEVSLTIDLADAASPEEVARRFLAVVRNAPREGTDLILDVRARDSGETIAVTVSASQQHDVLADPDFLPGLACQCHRT